MHRQFLNNAVLSVGFPGGSVVKNPLANAGDVGSISRWGSSPEKEMATHSSIPAWEIPWTEEPDRLQLMGLQRIRCSLATQQQCLQQVLQSPLEYVFFGSSYSIRNIIFFGKYLFWEWNPSPDTTLLNEEGF